MNESVNRVILVPDTIGAAFEGGFYGGKIQSREKTYAVIWAPKAQGETRGVWLGSCTSLPGAASCYHSMDNTSALLEAGSPLAKWARGLEINGFSDWCVPARDVLELAYRYLKPSDAENERSFRDGDNASSIPVGYPYSAELPAQTTVEDFRAGNTEAFDEAWYWSSTQYSDSDAFLQNFDNGNQSDSLKKYEGRCRAVRFIQLSA